MMMGGGKAEDLHLPGGGEKKEIGRERWRERGLSERQREREG